MARTAQLGDFLRSRRTRLRPEDVGIPVLHERRRVRGLRREEIAQLAGVSVSYYTRLEQGQSQHASAEVLDAISTALRLDGHEHEHLRRLAETTRRPIPQRRPEPEQLTQATRDLMRSFSGVPVLALGQRTDILAWNDLGHALLGGHLGFDSVDDPQTRPNLAKMVFLDPRTRDLYADWPRKASGVVGHLRLLAGRHPDDAELAGLIGELTIRSDDFAAFWADHVVRPCTADTHELRHPVAGPITVTQQTLLLSPSSDQAVAVSTTEAGSESERALARLAERARS
ncbi:helix-turn-helix transcriptional regulator [Saccharopolyspora taberi]|uniref:Helix-turn-helix transcriptional regulator n=1 Tax=Saccharopolyspora taberi TaxID=60895 RepID=A0ABN3VHX5_9PSEU